MLEKYTRLHIQKKQGITRMYFLSLESLSMSYHDSWYNYDDKLPRILIGS